MVWKRRPVGQWGLWRWLSVACVLSVIVKVGEGLWAQGSMGYIRGYVYHGETGEPLPYATVWIPELPATTYADENGFFGFRVRAGTYTVYAWFPGYDTARVEVSVRGGMVHEVRLGLRARARRLRAVEVRARREERDRVPAVSMIRITPRRIYQLPGLGKQDLIQYIQTLPGVVTTGDVGGRFFVRGGSPVQILTLLDGLPIYALHHTIGLFSVLPTAFLRDVTFFAGGYPAWWGGRLSSVISLKSRYVTKPVRVWATVNPLVGDVTVNLPSGGQGGLLVSGQYSRLNRVAPVLYPYLESDRLPYAFHDVFGKWEVRFARGSQLHFLGFYSWDSVGTSAVGMRWYSSGGGVRYVVVPPGTRFLLSGVVGYSAYGTRYRQTGLLPSEARLSSFHGEAHIRYPSQDQDFRFGIQLQGFNTLLTFYNIYNALITYRRHTSELALYLSYRRKWTDWLLTQTGFRVHLYATESIVFPEPRLRAKVFLTPNLRLKGAAGIYSQSLFTTTSTYEVTHLFVGYLNLPDERLYTPSGKEILARVQSAGDVIGGVEWSPLPSVWVSGEVYYKQFFRLFSVNRYKMFPQDPNYMVEDGRAWGLDFFTEYTGDRLYAHLTYTLLFVYWRDRVREYVPWFGRRHMVVFVGWWALDRRARWKIAVQWLFGSGLPYTPTGGFFPSYSFSQGIFSDYVTDSFQTMILLDNSQFNRVFLPPYHRLDISVERVFRVGGNHQFTVFATLFNAYNRWNILHINRLTGEQTYQLPILPLVGLRWGPDEQ